MKYIVLILGLWTLPMSNALAAEAVVGQDVIAEREALVGWMKDTTLAVLQDSNKSYEERSRNLRNSFAKVVDIEWISKFVLGAQWRKANAEQREDYQDLYHRFLMKAYVEAFGQNPDRKIRDMDILQLKHEADRFTTYTSLKLSTGESLKVNYVVVKKEGSFKIIDIVIENVSMLSAHRAEFTQIASARGIAGLLDILTKRIEA